MEALIILIVAFVGTLPPPDGGKAGW